MELCSVLPAFCYNNGKEVRSAPQNGRIYWSRAAICMKIIDFFSRNKKEPKGKNRAAELLEFALAAPVVIMLVFGMLDVSKALIMYTEAGYAMSKELNYEITQNSNPDISRAARNAGDTLEKQSIFYGFVRQSDESGNKFSIESRLPNQGKMKQANSSMGLVVCLDATIPMATTIPLFETITISKTTCAINEAPNLSGITNWGARKPLKKK